MSSEQEWSAIFGIVMCLPARHASMAENGKETLAGRRLLTIFN
jgi:hypothetical protein